MPRPDADTPERGLAFTSTVEVPAMRNSNDKILRLSKQGLIEYQTIIKSTTEELDRLVTKEYKQPQNNNEAWLVRKLYHWLRIGDSDDMFFIETINLPKETNIILSEPRLYHFLTILLLIEYVIPSLQGSTKTVKSGETRLHRIKADVKEVFK